MQYELLVLPRTSSYGNNNRIIIPSSQYATSSFLVTQPTPVRSNNTKSIVYKTCIRISTLLRSFLTVATSLPHALIPIATYLPSPSAHRKMTGTLFGHRRGHVTFAVQTEPTSTPVLVIRLAVSTDDLVREMSSGLLRIALESEKKDPSAAPRSKKKKLYDEDTWKMYCNGKKCGKAVARTCNEMDLHVLRTVRAVSVGAGVIPIVGDGNTKKTESEGELMYMRARFERVVGSRDSEAFYMMNPDGNGGPDLSIFLLRI